MRKPDFNNILKVLRRQKPERDTLFEFYLNRDLEEFLAGRTLPKNAGTLEQIKLTIDAYYKAGYDYVPILGSDFAFKRQKHDTRTYSANEGAMILDEASYDKYEWANPENADYSRLKTLKKYLPEGMKFIVYGLDGVLENVIGIIGYENLCLLLYDNPQLVKRVFSEVGTRLLRYYELCLEHDCVGAIISNDDWGYKGGLMLSPNDMREFVFLHHQKIAEAAHKKNKPAILHSCGKLDDIYREIYEDLKFDAKHSNEDCILPVEDAYEKYADKIAILGGIDLDFLIRESEQAIRKRCKNMLERARERGGYALGSGNSIPSYVPIQNYMAMIECIKEQ